MICSVIAVKHSNMKNCIKKVKIWKEILSEQKKNEGAFLSYPAFQACYLWNHPLNPAFGTVQTTKVMNEILQNIFEEYSKVSRPFDLVFIGIISGKRGKTDNRQLKISKSVIRNLKFESGFTVLLASRLWTISQNLVSSQIWIQLLNYFK